MSEFDQLSSTELVEEAKSWGSFTIQECTSNGLELANLGFHFFRGSRSDNQILDTPDPLSTLDKKGADIDNPCCMR